MMHYDVNLLKCNNFIIRLACVSHRNKSSVHIYLKYVFEFRSPRVICNSESLKLMLHNLSITASVNLFKRRASSESSYEMSTFKVTTKVSGLFHGSGHTRQYLVSHSLDVGIACQLLSVSYGIALQSRYQGGHTDDVI